MTYHLEPDPYADTDWRDERWRCPDCGLWTDADVCPECAESDPAASRETDETLIPLVCPTSHTAHWEA